MRQRTAALVGGGVVLAGLIAFVVGVQVLTPDSGLVCTAMGYIETIPVEVTGHPGHVASMKLCSEAGCGLAPHSSTASDVDMELGGSQESLGEWRFGIGDKEPDRITITAYGAEEQALATRTVDLAWRRSAPGDQCNVSLKTDPVELRVP